MNIKKSKTNYIGKNIIYKEELESTQKLAKGLIKTEVQNGTIVITDNQTNGIGTKGRTWYSNKEKNITMTIICFPNCKISKLDGFTVKVAECMKQTIKELYDIELQIKHPNDLILNSKKIGGILVETTLKNEEIKSLLIGIGFNVNETEFSEETIDIATSLKNETNKEYEREEIIKLFVEKLEKIL